MSVDILDSLLVASGVRLTVTELAEVIWLATRVDLGAVGRHTDNGATPLAGSPEPGPPDGATADDGSPPPPAPAADSEPFGLYLPEPGGGADAEPPVDDPATDARSPTRSDPDEHLSDSPDDATGPRGPGASPGRDGLDAVHGYPLLARTVSALPGALDVLRALRPLKRRVPSNHTYEVDEESTARRIAEQRVWIPVLRPLPDRWPHLTLVLDQSSVEGVWGRLGHEVQTLLEQLGAFRTIRVVRLRTGADGVPVVTTQADPVACRPRPASGPANHAGDQVVFVLSDCVGRGWRTGAIGRMLARWARTVPVAILQPLPDALWHRTGITPLSGRLFGGSAGIPAAAYTFTGGRPHGLPAGTAPVPVLEIHQDWLRPWARLVAGDAVGGIDATVFPAGGAGPDPPDLRDPPEVPDRTETPDPLRLVRDFRAHATPPARQLAQYLAAAVPLSVAVIRLVQAVMVPDSQPSHLAEVVFSGLLTPVLGSGDDQLYEFVPGVRDVLLETLRQDEGWRVLAEVSGYLDHRVEQTGAPFSAVVAAPAGNRTVPALREPFARVRANVLRRLTGRSVPARPLPGALGPVPTTLPDVPPERLPGSRPGSRRAHPGYGPPESSASPVGGEATGSQLSGAIPSPVEGAGAVGSPGRVVILHLTGIRLSPDDRVTNPGDWAADSTLAGLATLGRVDGNAPNLVVVTGDLARRAMTAEYQVAHEFLAALRARLDLPAGRILVVPGMGDVNVRMCHAYFVDRAADGESPLWPYWPKWEPFAGLLAALPGTEFQPDQPWYLARYPELRLVVAGLNSTMEATHRDTDRYGALGEAQLRWFAERMRGFQRRGWLRVGALYHDPAGDGATGLRDAVDFTEILAPHLDLVLHGRDRGVREVGITGVPAVGTTATTLAGDGDTARYQLVDVRPGALRVLAGRPGQPPAPAETHEYGDHWWPVIDEGEPDTGDEATPATDARLTDGTRTDLVARVATAYQVRQPEASVTERPWPGADDRVAAGYLLARSVRDRDRGSPVCLGVYDGAPTRRIVRRFLDEVVHQLPGGSQRDATLVTGAGWAEAGLTGWAAGRGVRLVTFADFQLGDELARYAARQAESLVADGDFPARLYVPQRYADIDTGPGPDGLAGQRGEPRPDLVGELRRWLAAPERRVIGVLGQSGLGKSFLLRELARGLHADGGVVPVVVDLRDMDWSFGLDQLVTVQLRRGGEHTIDLAVIRYLLREGRVALLCDGLDDLAASVDKSRARTRWRVVRQASIGRGKIVLVSRDQEFLADVISQSAQAESDVTAGRTRAVELVDFDSGQILDFLSRRLGGRKAATRLGLLGRVGHLLGMARNPRMLAFIAGISDEQLRAATSGGGPVTAGALYQRLITEWLDLERRERSGHASPVRVPARHLWQSVTFLALRLWESGEPALGADALGTAADMLTRLAASSGSHRRPSRKEAARLLGANTLLVRDREYRFTFVDRSVLEWLVARAVADQLAAGGITDQLRDALRREMSPLMIDFLCDLAGAQVVRRWADSVLTGPGASAGIHRNARRVLEQATRRVGSPQPGAGRDGPQLG